MSREIGRFAWQQGYGGFGVSKSNIAAVARYIQNQEQHHRRMTFEEESIALLKKHGIEYDPETFRMMCRRYGAGINCDVIPTLPVSSVHPSCPDTCLHCAPRAPILCAKSAQRMGTRLLWCSLV
jgi:hypothetical protein